MIRFRLFGREFLFGRGAKEIAAMIKQTRRLEKEFLRKLNEELVRIEDA